MGFRVIEPTSEFPKSAVSLFHEVSQHEDVFPSWMSGGGVYREWMCPIYGPSSEVEMMDFLYSMTRLLKPELVIEGGCHLGLGTYALGRALQDNGHGKCLSSDINEDYVARSRERCSGLPVEIRLGSTSDLPIADADLLFCDSDYPTRVSVLDRMKSGAVAVVHDTRQSPELKDAISGFDSRIDFDQTWRGFTLLRKSAPAK